MKVKAYFSGFIKSLAFQMHFNNNLLNYINKIELIIYGVIESTLTSVDWLINLFPDVIYKIVLFH